jgi:hypothetical protein
MLALLWSAGEMLDTESQESHAEWSAVLRMGGWFGHFGVLVPLALLGVIAMWHERSRLWILYAMTIAYAASVLAFYVFARYRFPLVPFLMLFAAAGVCALPALVRAFVPARRWGVVAVVGAVAVCVNWPVLSTTMMRAVTENNFGVALQEGGRLDAAVEHYRRSADIRFELGSQGRLTEAIEQFEEGMRLKPGFIDAQRNLETAKRAVR